MDFREIPLAPGGEGWLGHSVAFSRKRMELLYKLAQAALPIMRLHVPIPGARLLMVNDPDLVQELLVEKSRSFDKAAMLRFVLFPLAGEGLFTANGELWKRQRKLMAPLFQQKALERYANDIVSCALRTVERWQDGQSFALLAETTRLTMGVAGKTLFNADTFTDFEEIGRAVTAAFEWSGWAAERPLALIHVLAKRMLEGCGFERAALRLRGPVVLSGARGRALAAAIALLNERVQRMIDERRKSGTEHADLLARLLSAREEDGGAMDDRQVRDEVLTLFGAGHETTATGLAWTLALLLRHPERYAEVEREVDAVGDAPVVADLPRLGATLRAFREALRLYPPLYVFGRDSRGKVSLGGYDLPSPSNVLVSPFVLHRRASLWPDPERFDPDRFLPEHEVARHRYAYLPFGAGPRVCIGQQFAYMEAQLALCVLMRRWRFELLAEDEPEPGATLRPKHGVRVRVRSRRNSA